MGARGGRREDVRKEARGGQHLWVLGWSLPLVKGKEGRRRWRGRTGSMTAREGSRRAVWSVGPGKPRDLRVGTLTREEGPSLLRRWP